MTTHHYATPEGTQYEVVIERDDDAMSPRDADNVTIMVTADAAMAHPDRHYVRDSALPMIPMGEYVESRRYSGSVDMRRIRKYAALFLPDAPGYQAHHRVIAIAGLDVCNDWSPTLALTDDDTADGYIAITRQSWDMCMGPDTVPTRELCRDIMAQEIDAYNRWAMGEYVQWSLFQRVEWTREDTGDTRQEWELIEACGSIDDEAYALRDAESNLPDGAVSIDVDLESDPDDIDTLDCTRVGSHHSEDRVTVYHGSGDPYRVCGFHASQESPEWFVRMRPEGN